MKKIIAFFAIIILVGVSLIFFASRTRKETTNHEDSKKVIIAASFYPLAEFSKRIGGNYVDVVNITPAGIEAHDYEPTPQDIIAVKSAGVFIYQGSGFDPWAERIAQDVAGKILVINMSQHFDLRQVDEKVDPHIWLDPVLVKKESQIISETLKKTDPAHANIFEQNYNVFAAELDGLDSQFRVSLSKCKLSEIIVSHDAFGYLGSRYGIGITSISGISPEEEPSAQKLGEIAKMVRAKKIPYIFFETLISPKLADTIASEAGVGTLVLNPMEGLTEEEIKAGKDYLSVMRDNLHNLERALQCKNQNQS